MKARFKLLPFGRSVWLLSVLLVGWLSLLVAHNVHAQDSFLSPDEAFQANAILAADGKVRVEWVAAPRTYLYKDKLTVNATPASAQPAALDLPQGQRHHDEAFGKEVESLRGQVSTVLRLPERLPTDEPVVLTVGYQGCADAGLCYPPQQRQFKLGINPQGQVEQVEPMGFSNRPDTTDQGPATRGSWLSGLGGNTQLDMAHSDAGSAVATAETNPVTQALASGNWLHIALVCFGAGLLLSLTPCVLPMVPILSSILVGGEPTGRARGLVLALSYSQGMALVYTLMGVAAGLMGQGLAAYLQHPWVVLGFAAVMVLLALSMFGLYELQLPARVQSWLSQHAQRLPGGRLVGVFVMGAVSALVVSPCVSAPLAGALLYIGQSGNVALGATALYAMAWGMSVPLLLVGLSMGQLLPKAGRWMVAVKTLCGLLILALAAWMVRPAWPFLKAQLTGEAVRSQHTSVLPFQRIQTVAALEAALAQARQSGQMVMLDFYADWCVACIDMENTTFRDPRVQSRLRAALLLQVDVTANTAEDRALLQRFKLFGPPAILLFKPDTPAVSPAQPDIRIIGYQAANRFLQALQAAGL